MLKRAWLVLSIAWFLLVVWTDESKSGTVTEAAFIFAVSPFVLGLIAYVLGRYIVTGKVR